MHTVLLQITQTQHDGNYFQTAQDVAIFFGINPKYIHLHTSKTDAYGRTLYIEWKGGTVVPSHVKVSFD